MDPESKSRFPAKSSLLTADHVEQGFQNFKTFFWQRKSPLPFFFFPDESDHIKIYELYKRYIFQRSRALIPDGCLRDSQQETQGLEERSLKTGLERDAHRFGAAQASAGPLQ